MSKKDIQRNRWQRRKAEKAAIVQSVKSNTPCTDCGKKFHYCQMDFDHVEGKDFPITRITSSALPVRRLLEELAKCEVVCANCHRMRTFKRTEHAKGEQ